MSPPLPGNLPDWLLCARGPGARGREKRPESLREKARTPGRLARALRPFCTARLLSLGWAVPPGQRGLSQAGSQRPVQTKRCPGRGG